MQTTKKTPSFSIWPRLVLASSALLSLASARADDGVWTNLAGGSWAASANWNGGTIANGPDGIADFSTLNLAASATVTLDGPRTIGNLLFGDTTTAFFPWILTTGTGGPLTLDVSGGSPTITLSASSSATIGAVLAGTKGLTFAGTGALTLTNANTYSGGTFINTGPANGAAASGSVIVGNANAFGTGDIVLGNTAGISAIFFNNTWTVTNNLQLSSAAVTTSFAGTDARVATYSGVVSGGNASAIFWVNMSAGGSSGVLKLANVNNTFRATMYFNRGVLAIAGDGCLGNAANLIRFDQTSNSGGFRFDANNINVLHNIELISRCDLNVNGFDAVISSVVSGAATSSPWNIKGGVASGGNSVGSLRFTGNNTHVAPFTIAANTKAVAASPTALGAVGGTWTVASGGTLAFDSFGTYANAKPLNLNGAGVTNGGVVVGALQNLAGNNTFNGPINLASASTIGVTAGSLTLGGAITNVNALTKIGPGTLTLAGTNTYTGATTVSAGKLILTTPQAGGGSVTVNDSATLGVNVNSATTIPMAALNLGSSAATTLEFNFNTAPSLTVAPITVTNLTANGGVGAVTININGNLTLIQAQFPLIKYVSGTIAGSGYPAFVLGALPPFVTASLVNNTANNSIDLKVTAINQPVWSGALGSDWSTNILALPKNWVAFGDLTTPIDFSTGNSVLFSDAASGSTAVDISVADVSPASVLFNNSAKNYLLTGTRGIGGATGLTKTGTGRTTLANTNSFTGAVTISGGTLAVTSDGALGAVPAVPTAGAVVVNGGVLSGAATTTLAANRGLAIGPVAGAGSAVLDVTNAATLTINGPVANNGLSVTALNKTGAGTLALGQAAAYTGNSVVSNGTLRFQASQNTYANRVVAIGAGAAAESAATLYLNVNQNSSLVSTNVTGAGTLRLVATGNSASSPDLYFGLDHSGTSYYGAKIGAATLDLGGSQRFIYSRSGHNSVAIYRNKEDARIDSAIVGAGGLTYISQMTRSDMETPLVLGGSNTFTGRLEIQRGSIYLLHPQALVQTNKVLFAPASGNNARLFLYGNSAMVADLESTDAGSALIANGNVNNNVANIPAATLVVQQGANTTYGGVLVDAQAEYDTGAFTSAPLSLTKNGNGTLTLGAANTYSGSTTVNAGTLALAASGSIANSAAITVAPGAVLDASAANFSLSSSQTLTAGRPGSFAADFKGALSSAGTLNVAGSGVRGTVTIAGDFNLQGGNLLVDLANTTTPGGGVNDLIAVSGALSLSGTTTITPTFVNGGLAPGTYTLVQASSLAFGDANNLILNAPSGGRQTYTLDTTTIPGRILLQVSGAFPATLVWAGTNGNAWDTSTVNWKKGLVADVFFNGDQVTFNDAATNGHVSLAEALQPFPAIVSNNVTAYLFDGAGSLSGPGGLIKDGGGTLTIVNENANSGITTILAGTIRVGTNGTTGSLGSGPVTNNGTLLFSRSDQAGFLNDVSGSGGVEQAGAGQLTLSGANTYTGTTTVRSGTLAVGSLAALGEVAGGTVVLEDATLDVNSFNLGAEPITVRGAGAGGLGAIVNNGGASQVNATRFVTLGTNATFGGFSRWDIRAAPTATLDTGGNPYKLTKVGPNQFSLVSVTVDPMLGDISVQEGVFSFEINTTSLGNPSNVVTVASGASFQLWAATNQLNKVIVLSDGASVLNGSGADTILGPITLNGFDTFNIGGTSLNLAGPVGGGGSLAKSGASPLTLSATNTYSGGTTIDAGTLVVANNRGLGTGDAVINAGGLYFNFPSGSTNVITNNVALPATGTQEFTLQGTPTNFTTVRLTGVVSGGTAGQQYNLLDTGVTGNHFNILTLENSNNNFAGNILMNRGTLGFLSDAALGDPANGIIHDTWNLNGALRFDADHITLNAGRTIDLHTSGNVMPINVQGFTGTIAGVIGGPGNLVKQGTGTLILTAANTYTGPTTISAGKLLVNGSLVAASAVTVQTNAALGGTGTVAGTVAVQLGGTIAPGASVGTLNTGAETWNGGGTYVFELSSPTISAHWDLLNIAGTLNVQSTAASKFIVKLVSMANDTTPGLLPGFDPAVSNAWTLATASGGVLNFDAAKFAVETTAFANAASGTFGVALAGNSLVVIYSPVVAPPVVTGFQLLGNGSFQVSGSGVASQSYNLMATTNLTPTVVWTFVTNTVADVNGLFNLLDVNAASHPARFYRIETP